MAVRKQAKREPRRAATPRPTLNVTWAAVVFGLLTVLFFHAVIIGGKTFVSPDATQPAGFVRVGEKVLYDDHVYPLWNPYVFLGMPSFASGAYNPLIYPPDWPVALVQKVLPFLPELTWMLIYYFLAGLFTFLLCREWGAHPEGALLAGVVFVFAPNLIAVGSHGHGSQLVDSAYLPLMLWLSGRWLSRGGLGDLAWLALAGGFQLLRGHVQICFYSWIAVAGFGLIWMLAALRRPAELAPRLIRLVALAVAAGLAFGLAGFYNLPLRDYARHSIRGGTEGGGVGMDYATQWSLAPYELPAIAVPSWVGFGGSTYWGGMPFTDYPNAYVGLVAVLLLVPAFLANGAPRVYALVLAVLSLGIAFGKHFPLYGFLYEHLPLFNKFRVPVMVVLLFQMAVALGVAWGWSAVLDHGPPRPEGERKRVDRLLLGLGGVLVLAFGLGVLGQDLWRSSYVTFAMAQKGESGQPYTAELAAFAYRTFVGDLGRAVLLGLLAVGSAWLLVRGKLGVALASVAVLVLMLIELWPVSGRVMLPVVGDPVQRNLDIGRDDVVDFLEKEGPPGTFRILPTDEILSNRYAGFSIASVAGYHAAKPRLFQDLVDAELLWPQRSGPGFNLGWLRLLNIRYIVMPTPLEQPPLFLREAYRGTRVVYENLLALPRATVLGRYHVVTPAKAILDSVRNGTSESADVTFLEEDPRLQLGPVEGATARIATYGLNDLTIDVETPGPGLLRLADLWYPDWVATVDDRPVTILKADYLLRAVPVPAGRHRVVFHFRSPALARGLTLSLVSLGLILGLFAFSWWRSRRSRPVEPAAAPAGG